MFLFWERDERDERDGVGVGGTSMGGFLLEFSDICIQAARAARGGNGFKRFNKPLE